MAFAHSFQLQTSPRLPRQGSPRPHHTKGSNYGNCSELATTSPVKPRIQDDGRVLCRKLLMKAKFLEIFGEEPSVDVDDELTFGRTAQASRSRGQRCSESAIFGDDEDSESDLAESPRGSIYPEFHDGNAIAPHAHPGTPFASISNLDRVPTMSPCSWVEPLPAGALLDYSRRPFHNTQEHFPSFSPTRDTPFEDVWNRGVGAGRVEMDMTAAQGFWMDQS